MTQKAKIKFIKEVTTDDSTVAVLKPFKMERDEQRRFLRLEISSPMSLNKLRDTGGNFWPNGDQHTIHGMILNISGGGVLVDVDQQLLEGDVVSMRFTVQNVETLDNVLGLVKRSDIDEGSFLVGIEFITREYLTDIFSAAEMDLLSKKLGDFNTTVRTVLNKYVRQGMTSGSEGRQNAY